jgi:hypothetical protein
MDKATAMLNTHTPTHDQIMTGGPPLSAPIMSTPDNAVQLETIEKQKPIMLTRLNVRLSSIRRSEAAVKFRYLNHTNLVGIQAARERHRLRLLQQTLSDPSLPT